MHLGCHNRTCDTMTSEWPIVDNVLAVVIPCHWYNVHGMPFRPRGICEQDIREHYDSNGLYIHFHKAWCLWGLFLICSIAFVNEMNCASAIVSFRGAMSWKRAHKSVWQITSVYWTNFRLLLNSLSAIGTVTAFIFVCWRMEISPHRWYVIPCPLNKIGLSIRGFVGLNRNDLDSKVSSVRNVCVPAIKLSSTWRMTMLFNCLSPSLYSRQGCPRDRYKPGFSVWCSLSEKYQLIPDSGIPCNGFNFFSTFFESDTHFGRRPYV